MRKIKSLIKGIKTSDGAGVSLRRIIGSPELNMLDPFLLLDEFGSDNPDDYIAGFPPHPHRGFETVTYMINGKFKHKDTAGNEGYLNDVYYRDGEVRVNPTFDSYSTREFLPQGKYDFDDSYYFNNIEYK